MHGPAGERSQQGTEEALGWAVQLRPELLAALRALQRLLAEVLARPGMKAFHQLLDTFSPESLLALGNSPRVPLAGSLNCVH